MCVTEYNETETMQMFKEEGREEGREEGIGIGREEGIGIGREEGVRSVISVVKKMGGGELDVIESVVTNMGLSEDAAAAIVKKYW